MLDSDVDRAYPAEDHPEPDVRARQARRRRLLDDIDRALEKTRANDPDWLDVSATLSKARCELSRDLADHPAPAPFTAAGEPRAPSSSRPVPGT